MKQLINNWSISAFVFVVSALISASSHAQDGGLEYLNEQGGSQLKAGVSFALLFAFAGGVIFIIFGAFGIRKIVKEQMPDEKKNMVWFNMIAGTILTVIPFIIALNQGILGASGSEADVTGGGDGWGL